MIRTWTPHAVALLLAIAVPVWDRVETRRLKQASYPRAKIGSYRRIVVFLWLTAALLIISVPAHELWRSPPMEGAAAALHQWRGAVLPVVIGLAVAVGAPVFLALTRPEALGRLTKPLVAMDWFLPNTSRERWWFAGLCVSAGVCEEIIYRGFLIRYLQALPFGLSLTGSVLIAALLFVLAHTYQGFIGAIAVGALALLFTALFFLTGSLWLPMLMHTAIDLRTLVLWRARSGSTRLG